MEPGGHDVWFDITGSDGEETECCNANVPSRKRGHVLDLPDELLQFILGELSAPKELAAMAVQCSRLILLTDELPVWEEHCKSRWAKCHMSWTWLGGHGWAAIYRQLAALPRWVVCRVGHACACRRLHKAGMDPVSRTFQRTLGETNYGLKGEDGKAVDFLDNVFMKAVFALDVEAAKSPEVLDGFAAALLRRDLFAWLSFKPDFPSMYLTWGYEIVMMGYALEQDMHEYATRRSAVEFMPQLMGASAAASQHADMLQSLATEADEYDEDVLRHFHEQKRRPPRVFPPKGMPRTHWWWWMRKPGLP